MKGYARLAEAVRSGFVESVHFGSVVGLDAAGEVALAAGAVDEPILPRSSLKPLQALGCLTAGAPLEEERLAIAAGSHTGEDRHVAVVTQMLADAGLGPEALRCPPDWPEDESTRLALIRAGERPARVRMNCSGKHAAMLVACVAGRRTIERYLDPGHPLQRHIRATVERLAGEPATHAGVDGCGSPVFALTLAGLARAISALAVAGPGTPEGLVAAAMRAHPEYVGGDGHVNTELMRALPGAIAKGGAEGVLAAATAEGHAVAVKVIDGSPRATTPIAIAALAALGVDVAPAARLRSVPVLGGAAEVGVIRACEVSGWT
jgi:L-asparaginase II